MSGPALIEALRRRVQNLLFRGVLLMDDGARSRLCQVQGREGEVLDRVLHLLPYGLTFRILAPDGAGNGADTVILSVEPDLRVALPAGDRRYQPSNLAPGEVCLHTDEDMEGGSQGHCRLHFKRGRLIEIHCTDVAVHAANDVRIEAGHLFRVDAPFVRIRGTEETIVECNGHGFQITPTVWHSWTIGGTGQSHPITPPEIPGGG